MDFFASILVSEWLMQRFVISRMVNTVDGWDVNDDMMCNEIILGLHENKLYNERSPEI